jgi:hypothetical protein
MLLNLSRHTQIKIYNGLATKNILKFGKTELKQYLIGVSYNFKPDFYFGNCAYIVSECKSENKTIIVLLAKYQ